MSLHNNVNVPDAELIDAGSYEPNTSVSAACSDKLH